ncbi:MAG: pre-peptidase C-terminal domain-containing protein [Xenococcaceae cyanobacterium MO_188.B32]|nr:pre-peptidase C-terminal domain-containing protein [Xenococcaceae cyanobacterium MO_188.B32]
MISTIEKKSQVFSTDVFDTSSLALEPSVSNSGVRSELVDPVKLNLSRASSTPSAIPDGGTYNLGNLSSSPIKRNNYSVTPRDPTDVFKFRIIGTRSINLNLHNISAGDDADLRLYQDSNRNGILDAPDRQLKNSRRGSNRDDSINYRAGSGTYFAKVERYALGSSDWVRYSLHLSATPTSGVSSQRASNLLPIETNIGTLNGTRTFTGLVGNTNTSDVFRFRLGSNRSVNLTLAGLSKDSDLRLIRDANGNRIVDSGDVLVSSTRGSNNSEWISRFLRGGNYFVQVHQYSGNTRYYLSTSTGDWYSRHLSDPGIIGLARQFARDGQLSRNDMIGILRDTKDYGSVSGTELRDLRTLVVGLPDAPRPVSMPGYVYNLSYKTVYGDPANNWWTGGAATRTALGDLVAGSSATQMERLIGKWFLGLDRPTAVSSNGSIVYGYRPVRGSLFRGGANYWDIRQGGHPANPADCYFLAMLAGTAFRSPSQIGSMFIDNGDNTWTVRFYRNGVADYVTVDRYLPTNGSGHAVFAGWGGGNNTNVNNELWVALAEKAYAQINESNWIGQNGKNEYHGIDYGSALLALEQITARNTTNHLALNNFNTFLNAYNEGRIMSINTQRHVYTVVGYNSSTRNFAIYDPYGSTGHYTWSFIKEFFYQWGHSTS